MKLGFYDSGLGGISVLKEFIKKYGNKHSYLYIGDSARAPYGERSPEELKSYILEFADLMQNADVDIMISACNTSSMYLSEVDLSDYSFEVISLYEVMKKFFDEHPEYQSPKIALLATNANINSGRYQNWNANIYPLKCPTLVPLIENLELAKAKEEWQKYLAMLPDDIKTVIIGCTHYSFLKDNSREYLDPAEILIEQFDKSVFNDTLLNYNSSTQELNLEMHFTTLAEDYEKLAYQLLV